MKEKQWGRCGAIVHNEACLYSAVISGRLPFLNDDDDGTQQEDEDYQTSSAHPKNQPHLLWVLGHLQSLAVIFAGG